MSDASVGAVPGSRGRRTRPTAEDVSNVRAASEEEAATLTQKARAKAKEAKEAAPGVVKEIVIVAISVPKVAGSVVGFVAGSLVNGAEAGYAYSRTNAYPKQPRKTTRRRTNN